MLQDSDDAAMVPEEVLLQLSTSASDMIQASASRTAAVVASAVAGSGQKAEKDDNRGRHGYDLCLSEK